MSLPSFLQRLSITHKLTLLMVGISTFALVLASLLFSFSWTRQLQESMEQNLTAITRGTAASIAPLLGGRNQAALNAALEQVLANPEITGASVFDPNDRLLTRVGVAPEKRGQSGIESGPTQAECTLPVLLGKKDVGSLTLVYDVSRYAEEQREFWVTALSVTLCGVIVCVLVSFWVRRWLARPIVVLASLARQISEDNDFSRRAEAPPTQDELASLYTSFNHMLGQVEERTQRLRRRTQVLQLMESVSRAANQSLTPNQVMLLGMDSICAYTGWGVAHAWKRTSDGVMVSTGLWRLEEVFESPFIEVTHVLRVPQAGSAEKKTSLKEFQAVTKPLRCSKGEELPGLVLASGEPVVITDVSQDHRCWRMKEAREAGLKAAFAFPVLVGEEVVAVLEFFHRETDPPDRTLLRALGQVGAHLGRVFERERTSHELVAAKNEAERANRSKSAFLATMSHEIRTPLNAVLGMTSLLLETPLTPEQRDYARTVRSSGEGLLAVINDILDFSKIEAGHLELERIPFDVWECVEGALDVVATLAANKGLELAYLIEPEVPAGQVGDTTRLRQILINLLSNAIKFTTEGEIVLTVNRDGDSIHFAVRDSGIGIPEDRIKTLFAPFTQVDSSITRRFGGTGLGLAISRSFVEAMGGRIWVESELGKGSTFQFTIKAEEAPLPPRPYDQAPPEFTGKRLLLVDDNDTNRLLLQRQVERWGMVVSSTASPLEAFSWVEAGQPFDLAILDFHMPEMDGVELGQAIRAFSPVPLIGWTSPGRREGPWEGLFTGFLHKPLRAAALFETLLHVLGLKTAPVPTSTNQPLGKTHPLKILVADDMFVNQKMMLLMLRKMGYEAELAGNGLEVLQALKRSYFDLILMDVNMPEMDGLEATRRIVAEHAFRPRIIALTAHVTLAERDACLSAGMDDFLSKPIQPDALRAALLRCQPGQSSEGPTPALPRESLPVEAEWRHQPVLDEESLGNLRDVQEFGGVAAVLDLVETLEGEYSNLLSTAQRAWQTRDWDALKMVAHTIKGSSGNFGAKRLSRLAATLEECAMEHEESGLEEMVASLEEECRLAVQAFRQQFTPA